MMPVCVMPLATAVSYRRTFTSASTRGSPVRAGEAAVAGDGVQGQLKLPSLAPPELRGGVFSNKLDIIPSLSLTRSSHFFCTHLAPAQWEAARGFKCRPLTRGLTFDLNRLCGCIRVHSLASSETIDCTRFFLRPYSVASWYLFHCLTEYL